MFTIKKAIIKIDTDEYIENLSKYDGYIDCSDSLREPSEVCDVCSFDSADKAEKEIEQVLRPDAFASFAGQEQVVANLRVFVKRFHSKVRNTALILICILLTVSTQSKNP